MPVLFAYFETADLAAAKAARFCGRTYDIDKRWSFRADPPQNRAWLLRRNWIPTANLP